MGVLQVINDNAGRQCSTVTAKFFYSFHVNMLLLSEPDILRSLGAKEEKYAMRDDYHGPLKCSTNKCSGQGAVITTTHGESGAALRISIRLFLENNMYGEPLFVRLNWNITGRVSLSAQWLKKVFSADTYKVWWRDARATSNILWYQTYGRIWHSSLWDSVVDFGSIELWGDPWVLRASGWILFDSYWSRRLPKDLVFGEWLRIAYSWGRKTPSTLSGAFQSASISSGFEEEGEGLNLWSSSQGDMAESYLII